MKKKIVVVLSLMVFLVVISCTPTPEVIEEMLEQTVIAEVTPTNTPEPTQSIKTFSDSSRQVLGTWRDDWAFHRIITISQTGSKYWMKVIYSETSNQTFPLDAEVVGEEIRLVDATKSDGEYMIILSNGYLSFYDKLGFIYALEPIQSSSSTSLSTSSSTEVCKQLKDNLDLALLLSGGESTDLTRYYRQALIDNGCND